GRVFPDLHADSLWFEHSFDIGRECDIGALAEAVKNHTVANCDIHLFTIRFGLEQVVAITLIAAVTALHSFDAKIGGWVQALFTAVKVVLIVVFILGGLLIGAGDWGNFASQGGGLSNVATDSFGVSLMYVSF